MSVELPYIAIFAKLNDETRQNCKKSFDFDEGSSDIASCNFKSASVFLCEKNVLYLSAPVDLVIFILLFSINLSVGNSAADILSCSCILFQSNSENFLSKLPQTGHLNSNFIFFRFFISLLVLGLK